MRIMYLTDVGFDTPNSNNHLVLSMLEIFLKKGHQVYLVQSHSSGRNEDIPSELKKYENFSCDTVLKPATKKTNFVKRYLDGIKYEFDAKKMWKTHIDEMDVVLLQSHYTAVYAAWLLKRYRARIVFNIYDIFPGEAYTNGNIKSKFIYNCFAFLQRYLYKSCDYFFTLTEDTKKTLIQLGAKSEKIAIICNWYDESRIYRVAQENNRFAKKYMLDSGKKYIQYAGTLGVSYDFDFIINVARKLEYRNDIIFQIVGEGIKLQGMKEKVTELGVKNIEFLPWQELDFLPDVYSWSTLQIVPLRNDVIKNSYPSKILPLMACSRVAVVSVEEDSHFYHEMNQEKIGIASPLGDINAMAESILYLIDNPDVLEEYQKNAYKYVSTYKSGSVNANKMLERFEMLLQEEK